MEKEAIGDQSKIRGKFVPAKGNSWIRCLSKSHLGHVYYFNRQTGKATWNLTEAEIAEAKISTKGLEKDMRKFIEGCPEPKEPPMDQPNRTISPNGDQPYHTDQRITSHRPRPSNKQNTTQKNASSSRIYNKQIINNQYPKPTFQFPQYIPVCNHIPLSQHPSLKMALPTPVYNNLWPLPANHQIYVGPNPMMHQPQAPVDLVYNNPLNAPNTSTAQSSGFEVHENVKGYVSPNKFKRKWNYRDNSRNYKRGQYKRNFRNRDEIDLRKFLSAKRSQTPMLAEEHIERHEEILQPHYSNDESKMHTETDGTDDPYQSDADNDWLEDNVSFQGTKLFVDMANLKSLADSNADKERWIIAVDKTILLNHLAFLNIILNSDEKCLLMVSHEVVSQLNSATEADNMPRLKRRARRARDFLKQRLDAGCAVIGGESSLTSTEIPNIISCCLNLTKEKYYVVLLSNDVELQYYKMTTNVSIFTIKEIKKILTNNSTDEESHSSEPSVCPPIQITIPNNYVNETNDRISPNKLNVGTPSGSNNIQCQENNCLSSEKKEQLPRNDERKVENDAVFKPVKHTINAEVQTDDKPFQISETTVYSVNKVLPFESETNDSMQNSTNKRTYSTNSESPVDNRTWSACSDSQTGSSVNNSTTSFKRKTIRLNRSISSQPPVNNNSVEKRQYKWRRRRNVSNAQTNDKEPANDVKKPSRASTPLPSNVPNEINKTNNLAIEHRLLRYVPNESINKRLKFNDYDVRPPSSNDSSFAFMPSNQTGMTIEETSTSGVISNSTSNFDENDVIHQDDSFETRVDKHMFDVSNKVMEENLIMKSDEWISRFVQIMEEVLTEVLQQDFCFFHKLTPPPWTLYEATKCIKINFSVNYHVAGAANKLLKILSEINDGKGSIRKDLAPSEYMRMYSYGVLLVNTLKSVICCEDLQTATESLSKLLNDIRNPTEFSHNETIFPEHTIESSVNDNRVANKQVIDEAMDNNAGSELPNSRQNVTENCDKQPETYNLISRNKNDTNKPNEPPQLINAIDVKSKFLSSLNLHKNEKLDSQSREIDAFEFPHTLNSSVSVNTVSSAASEKMTNIEKPLDMDQLDYTASEEDNCGYQSDECCLEDQNYQEEDANENLMEHRNETEFNYESSAVDINDSNKLDRVFKKLTNEIKETFSVISEFCENTMKELREQLPDEQRSNYIYNKANSMRLNIDNMFNSMDSLFHRETHAPQKGIKTLLQMDGFYNIDLTDKQRLTYRDTIAKAMEGADTMLECITCILKNSKVSVQFRPKHV